MTINIVNVSQKFDNDTVCLRSPNPFYKVTFYVNWVKTSWKYCTILNEGIIMARSVIYLLFRKMLWLVEAGG